MATFNVEIRSSEFVPGGARLEDLEGSEIPAVGDFIVLPGYDLFFRVERRDWWVLSCPKSIKCKLTVDTR